MKIVITGEDFNNIMKTCVPVLGIDTARQTLRFIGIDCGEGGEGCATALDGFVMAQTRFKYKGDAGKMLLFPCKPVKNVDEVEISNDDERTTVSYGDYSFSRKVPASSLLVDCSKIGRDAQANKKTIRIAFSPELMAKVLKSHKTGVREPLYMDIYGSNDPIVVHSKNTVGLLLPYRVNAQIKEPEFWKEQEK